MQMSDNELLSLVVALLKEIRDDLKVLKDEHIIHFQEWREKNKPGQS